MRLVRGRTSNLGMLLGFHCVLVTLHVVVLAVMLCGGAMRLGGALVVLGRFCVCLIGHLGLPVVRGISRSITSGLNSVRSECICCF